MLQFIFGMLVGVILGFTIFAIFSIFTSERKAKATNPRTQNKGDSNAPK